MTLIETVADAVKDGALSFSKIRQTTGLKLSDAQLSAAIAKAPDQFRRVRFCKRDDEGKPIRPGRPGVRLKDGHDG